MSQQEPLLSYAQEIQLVCISFLRGQKKVRLQKMRPRLPKRCLQGKHTRTFLERWQRQSGPKEWAMWVCGRCWGNQAWGLGSQFHGSYCKYSRSRREICNFSESTAMTLTHPWGPWMHHTWTTGWRFLSSLHPWLCEYVASNSQERWRSRFGLNPGGLAFKIILMLPDICFSRFPWGIRSDWSFILRPPCALLENTWQLEEVKRFDKYRGD